jgi:signal transduction histidine kinase
MPPPSFLGENVVAARFLSKDGDPMPSDSGEKPSPANPEAETARLREELSRSSRSREILLASVAHDLRNPLNTFAMSAGLLRDDLERKDLDPTRALALLSRMDRAALRMQSLIEDLLEASRIDAKRIDLSLERERVAQIVRELLGSAKTLTSEKGATLAAGALDDEAEVEVDRARLAQALTKLIGFSLKATGEGGVVQLSVKREGPHVEVFVKAMPPGGAPKGASHDEGRGGLALLIARGLVEAHGGQVRLETTDDGPQVVVRLRSVA